jgi:hypothetical protein
MKPSTGCYVAMALLLVSGVMHGQTTRAKPAQHRPVQHDPVAPELSRERAYFYLLKMLGVSDVCIDEYGATFDAYAYQHSSDEFERNGYRTSIRNLLAAGVASVDFRAKFTLAGRAFLGEYDFEHRRFPLHFYAFDVDQYFESPNGLQRFFEIGTRDAINLPDFSPAVRMDPEAASRFVKTRKQADGSVDRVVYFRTTYSVLDRSPNAANGGNRGQYNNRFIFASYWYSIEVFDDSSLTRRLDLLIPAKEPAVKTQPRAEAERAVVALPERRATLQPAARGLRERADALHDQGDDAGALEAYVEAVKADSNAADLDTISRYAPFQYSNAPPPPRPGKQPSDEQTVARVSALQLAALRQYLRLRPNDWKATEALLLLVDLPEGELLLDPLFKSRPSDPEPYAARARLLERHHRFAEAADDRAKAAALDTQNPESYYMAGVSAYEAVAKEASLTEDQKRTLIGRGLTALERAETLRPDYPESMAYRNLLLRQKALLEADPAAQKKLIAEADEIRQRALESLRRRQAPKALRDPSAPSAAETGKRGYGIDDQTRLMWTVKDNGYDIDWNHASEYCSGLTLAGLSAWRLASIDELQRMFDPKLSGRPWIYKGTTSTLKISEPIQLSSCCVWSGTKNGSSEAWIVTFDVGKRFSSPLDGSSLSRALCVRVSER